jgi:hypothetical protein
MERFSDQIAPNFIPVAAGQGDAHLGGEQPFPVVPLTAALELERALGHVVLIDTHINCVN